jgi:hypothetical protein
MLFYFANDAVDSRLYEHNIQMSRHRRIEMQKRGDDPVTNRLICKFGQYVDVEMMIARARVLCGATNETNISHRGLAWSIRLEDNERKTSFLD